MRRVAVIFLTHLMLWALVGGLNHALAGWQVRLFAGGLFVTFPALCMGRFEGLLCSMLAGLLFDAAAPLPFGQTAVLFGVAHCLMLWLRPRLSVDEPLMQGFVAALAGTVLYMAKLATLSGGMPVVPRLWLRFGTELGASALLAAIAAPWFFSLQDRALLLLTREGRRRAARDDEEE